MMESRRKRVEQKGRFTITEIIPGLPYSSRVSSPTFQAGNVSVVVDDVPTSGSCDGVATIQPQPVFHQQLKSNGPLESVSNGSVELKMEETPELHTQPVEAALIPIEVSVLIAPETEAVAMDPTRKLSTPTAARAAAPGSPSRKYSSPKKSRDGMQRARRIKRRGRFTIIEMASDSPTSRKDSDELYDHRFVTTTSVGGSSVGSLPQQLGRSLDAMERRTKPKRATRSMPRLRQPSSMRRSRRRSESPPREFIESVDIVASTGNQQHQQEATAYAELQALSVTETTDALGKVTLTSATTAGTGAAGTSHDSGPVSMAGITIPDSEETVTATTSAFCPATSSSQLMNVSETTDNIVGPPQSTSMSISAAQFLEQQQTIASLIRQQHDLKQIIGVLQEQQQQLMSIPSQINELQSQSFNSGRTRDDETRELSMKVNTLTLANESLHSLLNAAEREVRHRKLQIECLSEENDELRQRCGQLELFLQPDD